MRKARFLSLIFLSIFSLSALSGCEWGANTDELRCDDPQNITENKSSDIIDPNGVKNIIASDGEYKEKIGLKWDISSDAKSYNVYRSDSAKGDFGIVATGFVPGSDPEQPEVNRHAEFVSDIDLSAGGLFGNKGVFVLGSQTPQVAVKIGEARKVISFPGNFWGHYYGQSEIIKMINGAFGKSVCSPDGSKFIKITSDEGAIEIFNEKNSLNYSAVPAFFKNGATSKEGEGIIISPVAKISEVKADPAGYFFYDKNAKPGKRYFYKVTFINAEGKESGFNGSDEGFVSGGAAATDGENGSVTLTWEAVPGAAYYRISRRNLLFNSSTLKYSENLVMLVSNYTSAELKYIDTTVPPGKMEYIVDAYSAANVLIESKFDYGYRKVSDDEFFREYDCQMKRALDKISLMHNSGTGKLGDETVAGDVSGTCNYYARLSGLTALIDITFTNYSDSYMVFNGVHKTSSNTSGNGSNKDCRIDVSGIYKGYVRYDLVITNQAESGGNYYVSQDGGPETVFPWNYLK